MDEKGGPPTLFCGRANGRLPAWRLQTAQRAAVLVDEREHRGAADRNVPAAPGCLGASIHERDANAVLTQTGGATPDAVNTFKPAAVDHPREGDGCP